jgi:NADPH:quinone reductase-like Zn-dependent oxidoreductase
MPQHRSRDDRVEVRSANANGSIADPRSVCEENRCQNRWDERIPQAGASVDNGRPKLRREDLVLLGELAAKGETRPVIDRTYALGDIVEAHGYVDNGHKRGNVVVAVA